MARPPLVDEAERARLIDHLRRLGRRLAQASVPDATLARGEAGLALTFSYLHRTLPDEGYALLARARLEAALAGLGDASLSPSLFRGFTGIAWVCAHLVREQLWPDDDGWDLTEIDAALEQRLRAPGWPGGFDLVDGLAGVALYAAEAGAQALLAAAVARLDAAATPSREGRAWLTPPEACRPDEAMRFASGRFDLGVAHGVPGCLAALGHAVALDLPGAARLRTDVVRWLLARRQPESAETRFADVITPAALAADDAPLSASRTSWCYGDLGVALALGATAERDGDPAWTEAALALGRAAAARPRARTGVVDAGLCHGAAGVMHLFHRLYRRHGDPLFAAAARAWLGETLGYLASQTGAACDLIDGLAGVTLALLAVVGDTAPGWDRLLAIST